jgi:hypothetical protein
LSEGKAKRSFLDFLIERGYIEGQQAETVRMLQVSRFYFGVLALREQFITFDDLEAALSRQAEPGNTKKIGEIMLEMGLMTEEHIDRVLEMQNASAEHQAQLVMDVDLIPESLLRRALEEFKSIAKDHPA